MKRTRIRRLLQSDAPVDEVLVKGWVRTKRDSKDFSFLELNDGSCLKNLQVFVPEEIAADEAVKQLTTGSAVSVTGALVASPGKGQAWEVKADTVEVIQTAPEDYPLQKKRHSDEFLRTIAHLRPRTNKYGAVFRIRSELAFAVHQFFRDRGFYYIHTPILTGSDCEGAGALFRVTALDLARLFREGKALSFNDDFFGKEANLTVSGQLAAEMFALSLGDVYTFGPTFRAENSNTRRHAAEFWMIEPESAFCDNHGNMDLAEALIKALITHVFEHCEADLELFARFVDKSLISTLQGIRDAEFLRLPYREAVDLLQQSGETFEYPPEYGADLQTEHERCLTERICKKPVIVHDFPKTIKPFYMRMNEDAETVAAMDVLVPGIGELVGGSQREERYDVLVARMAEAGLPEAEYWWYLDSRRYGSVPHSGFGLGFERMVMLVTGITNIRDVIPFPRTPRNIEF
jgi:asparaginyl-tRNA synthetase